MNDVKKENRGRDAKVTLPANFDWVRARAQCSVAHVFKELENGVRADMESAQQQLLLHQHDLTQFSVTRTAAGNHPRFSAIRVNDPVAAKVRSVTFVLERAAIQVIDDDLDQVVLTATLTLNDDGECKLKVGDEELDQWQFRRRALEGLLFNR